MVQVIDKNLGMPLNHYHPIKLVDSDPASAKTGTVILNTTDHKIKVYYASSWQELHELTPPVSGGSGSAMPWLWLTYP